MGAGAVPVLLTRVRGHRVLEPDPLRRLSARLDPTFALDHVEQLATLVRMPVVAGSGLEPNDGGKGRQCLRRSLDQLSRTRVPREVGAIHWLEILERVGARRDFH